MSSRARIKNPSSTTARRAALLLAAIFLTACGSDPVAPEPAGPPIAQWAGTYDGQSRFGATAGTWGNGGPYQLAVSSTGEVTVRGSVLLAPVYDSATSTLSWRLADGNGTNGEVTFHESLTSDFFFRDQPNNTGGRGFTGYIQRRQEGRLDYRGLRR